MNYRHEYPHGDSDSLSSDIVHVLKPHLDIKGKNFRISVFCDNSAVTPGDFTEAQLDTRDIIISVDCDAAEDITIDANSFTLDVVGTRIHVERIMRAIYPAGYQWPPPPLLVYDRSDTFTVTVAQMKSDNGEFGLHFKTGRADLERFVLNIDGLIVGERTVALRPIRFEKTRRLEKFLIHD